MIIDVEGVGTAQPGRELRLGTELGSLQAGVGDALPGRQVGDLVCQGPVVRGRPGGDFDGGLGGEEGFPALEDGL